MPPNKVAVIDGRYVSKGKKGGKKGSSKNQGGSNFIGGVGQKAGGKKGGKDGGKKGKGGGGKGWGKQGKNANDDDDDGAGWASGGRRAPLPGDEDTKLEEKFGVTIMKDQSMTAYLYNMRESKHNDVASGRDIQCLLMYFIGQDAQTYRATHLYRPYFFVRVIQNCPDRVYELIRETLESRFTVNENGVKKVCKAEILEKEDLSLEDHLVGRRRKLIKLSFDNNQQMREGLEAIGDYMMSTRMKMANRPEKVYSLELLKDHDEGIAHWIAGKLEWDVSYINRISIDKNIKKKKHPHQTVVFDRSRQVEKTLFYEDKDVQGRIEAQWSKLKIRDDIKKKPSWRIFAYDIECSKEPLKFPEATKDQITMISVMVDALGFLITNREWMSKDIEDFEYSPKPDFEGIFKVYNEVNEEAMLRRFFSLIREIGPHIITTFNGDFFDMKFVATRADILMGDGAKEDYTAVRKDETVLYQEIGISLERAGFWTGKWITHLDCYAWVQRDSYLPLGSRGLKAVTKAKLKYEPIEVDPEKMTEWCIERPQAKKKP